MDILSLLDEVQTIARNGLFFSENHYDRERYERLLALAVKEYAQILNLPDSEILAALQKEFGYITPKLGADSAIFNEQGEILLMNRSDGSGWCLPCGWVEPNETPAQAAIREVMEETGLEVRVERLVGVFTRFAGMNHSPHSMVAVVHLCQILSGQLTLSVEGTELRYWRIENVENWHATHKHYALAAYQCWKMGSRWQAVSE
jgi:8-oxo-dGTP pyrophosphatase MutT (NUDIX family)